MVDTQELPKLYIDWGKPNGDETAISCFDKNGTAHTVTGYPARVMAEQFAEIESLQKQLAGAREALKRADEGLDLLSTVHGKYADLNLSFADNWFSNAEEFFMHESPKITAALSTIRDK